MSVVLDMRDLVPRRSLRRSAGGIRVPSGEISALLNRESSMKQFEVAIVDDDEAILRMIELCLADEGYKVTKCIDGKQLFEVLSTRLPDCVILDLNLPDEDGLTILRRIRESTNELPIIISTAYGTVNNAVEAMKLGAYDFIMKPVDQTRLMISVRNATRMFSMTKKIERLESLTRKRHEFQGIIGVSKPMQAVYSIIENVGPSDVTCFITGSSGTGKELIAKALHATSRRKDQPFVPINCAAIPKDIIESELFGHEKGAFTGATSARTGCVEMAHGGTLFLDELCEMDINVQAKLLRFLQERNIRRVGGNKDIDVNVRVIAATNQNPLEAVENGTFREDLYFRLNVIPIQLPSLKDRKEDIPLLAMHFLALCAERTGKEYTGFSAEALERMMNYNWPGNVRELENTVERIAVLGIPPTIEEKMLPETILDASNSSVRVEIGHSNGTPEQILPFTEVEKKTIAHAISCCGGNISMAAKKLGLGQATLYRKIKKYGLSR